MASRAETAKLTRVNAKEQLEALRRGTVDLQVEEDLLKRLEEGRPLRVKAGFDPTRPDLHLGHSVLLQKMRAFQDLGHEIYFVVGDFTARIGDPSGKSATRSVPTEEEIREGARTYAEQAFKILDPDRTHVVYNSTWLSSLNLADVIHLAGKYRLARMMERDDFKKRWNENQSISIHELLYPLVQAYDSIHLKADVELGGTDQLFNLMVGRDLMREYGLRPQCVMTTPILEGLSARVEGGVLVGDKMSKSLDNYVGLDEPPEAQFGKLMSVSDELMWRYYELLSSLDDSELKARKAQVARGELHPKRAKADLALELVSRYHSREAALEAERKWEAQFSRREVPEDLPLYEADVGEQGSLPLFRVIADAGLVPSGSEARRRIKAGAVEIDGEKNTDERATLSPGEYIIKAGKRAWAKVILR
ncbi:MAG: tyrosine--tRNA ligase [Sandaracinaceae bacterium]|nr:tyrosine--tRNA ligase [Sandaracinaceae bacterium]